MSVANNPLVTVITVTYNSSAYVRDAIESILASSYPNFELIIGDDSSSDNTWEIVAGFRDPRIVKYRNEQNIGEYPNRNKAIQLAKGEYLIFIDGDDMIYPHGLDFMVKTLHAFPGCGMALMRWFKNNLFFPIVVTPHQFYVGEYFGHGFLGTAFSNVLFRTKILVQVGGLSDGYRAGDDFIRYRIASQFDSLVIGDGLTWWRETPGQASGTFLHSVEGIFESIEMKFSFLDDIKCPLSEEEIILAKENLRIILVKAIVRNFIKGRFTFFRKIKARFGIDMTELVKAFNKPIAIDPFTDYSPSNPYMHSFSSNPFSANYKV